MSLEINEQYDKIYRYCYFRVQNRVLAEDLTQETFLRYFAQNSYIHRGKQLAYLYTIARNLCIDHYRKKEADELKEEIMEEPMKEVETSLYVRLAVEQLPKEMQELILFRYVDQLSVREICEITGMSRSTEYRMEKEALRRLQSLLEER